MLGEHLDEFIMIYLDDIIIYSDAEEEHEKYSEVWHPVAYYSYKMTSLELNYDIYNKELLGIVIALKEWRVFLQNTKELFVVKTDHKNFTSFLITKELN